MGSSGEIEKQRNSIRAERAGPLRGRGLLALTESQSELRTDRVNDVVEGGYVSRPLNGRSSSACRTARVVCRFNRGLPDYTRPGP